MISYTWRVIESDTNARCMTVEYVSAGRETFAVSTRLPTADESIDAIIEEFAPVAAWEDAEKTVLEVAVGVSGAKTTTDNTPVEAEMIVPIVALTPVQL